MNSDILLLVASSFTSGLFCGVLLVGLAQLAGKWEVVQRLHHLTIVQRWLVTWRHYARLHRE